MILNYEPGDYVINPNYKSWGIGQIQSIVKNKVTEPVNLGSGSGISIKEIADIVATRFSKKIKWLADKPTGDAKRVFDTKRAKKYGFETTVSLESGINETINWFLENKDVIDKRYNVFK